MSGDQDRLAVLAGAMVLDVANRQGGEVHPAFEAGAQHMMMRLPDWVDDSAAGTVYGLAFAEGWRVAEQRFRILLGLPEARGREREALELAQDPDLEPAEIAVRLRAAAPRTEPVAGTDNVVAFRRPADRTAS